MRGFNEVILIGNCGKDPECSTLQDGVEVAKFSLATTDQYRTKDGKQQASTDWHSIVLWRGLATLAAKYVKAGSLVMIKGKLKYRNYEHAAGHTVYVTEVVADELILLDKKTSE